VNAASVTWIRLATGDRRQQEQVVLEEGEVAVEDHLQEEQQHRRHERDEQQETEQHLRACRRCTPSASTASTGKSAARCAGDRWRSARADVDGDDEDEEVLLLEELPEGLGVGASIAACG
jgi:hypothetical protein